MNVEYILLILAFIRFEVVRRTIEATKREGYKVSSDVGVNAMVGKFVRLERKRIRAQMIIILLLIIIAAKLLIPLTGHHLLLVWE